ncbi:MAG: M20/M25/M40 family metallo-hydrolase [Clostridia bacterium]|nr:M20/M25/M40 family metallo-hydrolase [Clostridia bacterium]
MKCKELFSVIDSLKEEYLQLLTELAAIESPTEYKKGVDQVGIYIAKIAVKKGWLTERQHQSVSGDVWCITMNPDAKKEPICFSGHMDTVHPLGSFGKTPVRRDGERLFGPGVLDCKGGIAASLLAMDALEKCGFCDRPVKLLLQSDEENGSRSSNKTTVQYMGEKAKGCIAFLNTESGRENSLIISTKGICKFRFSVSGKAAHSSRCHLGISAIREAAEKIIRLEAYKDPESITCNCGLIQGGSAENTVPESCSFTADFRFQTEAQRKEILQIADKIASTSFVEGTSCTCVLVSSRVAMTKEKRNEELFQKVRKIFVENGLNDVEMCSVFGGTDAADITQMGIPCLDGFGPLGGGVHSLGEYVECDSLALAAGRLASVAYEIE